MRAGRPVPNQPRMTAIRSRWAAIGAAVAVTLGSGGLFTAWADSSPSAFAAITPVRVLDTRYDIGLTGAFTEGQTRLLDVTGSIPIALPGNVAGTGSPVPGGATAIVANVTVVDPSTAGYVSVRPGDATGTPTTSSLNFMPGAVVPNSVTVELPTSGAHAGQVNLFFRGTDPSATTDLLIDIVGYYVDDVGTPGPQGHPGIDGIDGVDGVDGTDGADGTAPWDVIPSGTTVTGEFLADMHAGAQDTLYRIYLQLPGIAPADLTASTVNFAGGPVPIDDDSSCTGLTNAPTAPAGKFCLYLSAYGNVYNVQGQAGILADQTAAVAFYSTAPGDMLVSATWAYTAP